MVALAGWLALPCAFGQGGELLLRETFSREVSVFVGGVQSPPVREIASREVSVFIGQEAVPPYAQALSREVSVLVATPTAPARITQLVVTPSPTGDTVTLSWEGYNQWAEHDVARYDIYMGSQAFSDVTGLKPDKTVPSETFSLTLTGLEPWQDRFFAVVPVDALKNSDHTVDYAAAYIIARETVSREFSVFVGGEPEPPYQQALSREVSVLVTTPSAPARITQLVVTPSPTGDTVTLSWEGYNQWAEHDVARYDIYMGSQGFDDVTDLARYATAPSETFSLTLTGLDPWQDRFFAVVPVDALENFDHTVDYAAAYIIARETFSRELSFFVGGEPEPPYQQALTREVSVLVPTAEIPAPVTGLESTFTAVMSTRAFGAIDLDWTGYNEIGQHDVVRYRIYAGPAYFNDVTNMDPIDYAPADTWQWTLRGLTPLGVYHVAVVAEDALEHWNSEVRSASAQASIGSLGEVRQLAAACGIDSLRFTWLAPEGADPAVNDFLAEYRVYFAGATASVVLDRFATEHTISGLLPAHGYPFRITTMNKFGEESGGASLLAATLLEHPANLEAEPFDRMVRLTWDHAQPTELVQWYAVYVADADFASVAGMTPISQTKAAQADLSGLENGRTYYFAVTTVNTAGCEVDAVQTVSAVPNPRVDEFADLETTEVVGPTVAYPEQTVVVSWRVTNVGLATTTLEDRTQVTGWTDRIVLSRDDVAGNADDAIVADVRHSGALAVGEAYLAEAVVSIPRVPPGIYYVFAVSDALDEVYEYQNTASNLGMADQRLSVWLVQPVEPQVVDELATLTVAITPLMPAPPSGRFSYALVEAPAGVTGDAGTGTGSWTPSEEQGPGVYVIKVNVTDNGVPSLQQLVELSVTVLEVNAPPVFSPVSDRVVNTLAPVAVQLDAIDPDIPQQGLTFSLDASAPPGATIDAGTGLFTWTPAAGSADGAYSFTARVKDDFAPAAEASVTFRIVLDRVPPQVVSVTPSGNQVTPLSFFDVVFDEPADASAFAAGDATLTGPSGNAAFVGVSQPDATTLRFSFESQTASGSYAFRLLPTMRDLAGNPVDADGDGLGGEAEDDVLISSVSLAIVDLVVPQVSVPTQAEPGALATFEWTVRNQGTAPAAGIWRDTLYLSADREPGGDLALGTFSFNSAIAGGEVETRTAQVLVPATAPAGALFLVVVTDSANDIGETNEANNFGVSSTPVLVPVQLTLAPASGELRESQFLTATIARSGPREAALDVTLAASDATELAVPDRVTIPVGQGSASFTVRAVEDGVVDGTQAATITAAADGFAPVSAQYLVIDAEVPQLVLQGASTTVLEGLTLSLSVSAPIAQATDLTVTLSSEWANQLLAPVSVIIPAGQTTASFLVAAAADTLVEGDKSYTITASAAGHQAGSIEVTVRDDDVPRVTLAFSKTTLSEGDGAQAAVGTVSRDVATDRALTVQIVPDGMGLLLPLDVEIPASAVSASFAVGVVDNTSLDATRQLGVRGLVLESGGDRVLSVTETVAVTVIDDDGPTLKAAFDRALVKEGLDPAAQLTVSRNTDPAEPLVVELLCGDAAELTVPSMVIIPAGQASVMVGVASLDDGVTDGNKTVSVTARAAGFTEGNGSIVVSDMNLPDLTVTRVEGPADADTESFVSLTYRVENQGVQPAGPHWATRVFLSNDPIPGDDLLVGTYDFTGTIPPGQYYEQSISARMPTRAGEYWVVAEVDVADEITETLEDNNRRLAAQPIRVQSAYLATVATEIETALANTPIPLTGWALRANGLPAAEGSLVNIHVYVRGTHRVISALVDRQGRFATTWQPLPNEAGFYEIGAAHPGETDAPVQDTFLLVGMAIEPAEADLRIVEGSSVKGELRLVNLSSEPLTGLSWNVIEAPSNLTLSGGLDAVSLPALGEVVLSCTVTAHDASTRLGAIRLRVESVEGAVAEAVLDVSVEALRPRLAVEPNRLRTGMLRGAARTVEFTVSNLGGLASGPLNVVLPDVDWMTVVTPSPLPSLEPGGSTEVSLLLTPPAQLALGPYEGSLHVGNDAVGINVPFTFRAISEAIGDLRLTAVDELTYYAEGSPKLVGASVVVRDPVTQAEVARGLTDANGELFAAGLAENYYEIEVTAEKHSVYRGTHLVVPGEVNEVRAFLSRQTVTYSWTVEPIEIEDRYHIEIETTFETVVPVPVVTVEPAVIDLALITADVTQVDLKITNHGLIAAENARLSFPTHPLWQFIPLIEEVGLLPARSSLVIPVTIRRIAGSVALAGQPQLANGNEGPCTISAGLDWSLVCGPDGRWYRVPVLVINARGNCGTWGGTGTGTGGGGGIGSPGMPFLTTPSRPTSTPCSRCDPEVFHPSCVGAEFGMNLGQIEDDILDLINKMFPPYFRIMEASVDFTVGGELCDCCEGEKLGREGELSTGITAGVELGLGFFTPDDLFEWEWEAPGFGEIEVEFEAFAGIKLDASGSGTAQLAWECHEIVPELCVEFGLGAEIGPTIELRGSIEAEADGLEWEGEITGTLKLTTTGKLALRGCGDRIEGYACFDDLVAAIEINGSVTAPGQASRIISISLTKQVVPGNCNGEGEPSGLMAEGAHRIPALSGVRPTLATGVDKPYRIARTQEHYLTSLGRFDGRTIPEVMAASAPPEGDDGVCARVRLRVEQEAVLSRDAFRATLEIENLDASALTDIEVQVRAYHAMGHDASELLGVRPPTLTGLSGVDGTGVLAGRTTGSASWTIIPTVDAATDGPLLYSIGGEFAYTQDGVRVRVPLSPVDITVLPTPRLWVKYFHQRDVYSDDPYTDQTEPSIPFNLAVMIENRGAATARDMRITSAQPKIVENEKGLLIDFKLIATEVAGQNMTPSMTANFGDIVPGSTKVGRWLMTSTLQGLFLDYTARFEHVDGLGNPRLSIIEDLSIHELIRLVNAGGSFDDAKPDFFVNAVPDLLDLGDTLYLSNGTTNEVERVDEAVVEGALVPGTLSLVVTAAMPAGWGYLRIPDPAQGHYRLAGVVRSDGVPIPLDVNVWTTDRTFLGLGKRPRREYLLHLLDHGSTGRYTLYYEEAPAADNTPPLSAVNALPAESPATFPVTWTGIDEVGGGLAGIDVYYSEDGASPVLWIESTLLQGAFFTGELNRQYAFFTRATDRAGNREAAPSEPDAVTRVSYASSTPSIAEIADRVTDQDVPVVVPFTVSDPDTPLGNLTITVESSNLTLFPTTHMALTGTGEERTVRLVPAANRSGTATITLMVTDGSDTVRRAFTMTVRPVNDPPIAGPDIVQRPFGRGTKVAASELLSNDSDPEFEPLRIVAVSPASAQGAAVSLADGWVFYHPEAGMNLEDTFTYTVADSRGATGLGTVTVRVVDADSSDGFNRLAPPVVYDGKLWLRFLGIPARWYRIQRVTNLADPLWEDIGSVLANERGLFDFVDDQPPAGAAYYRAVDATQP